MDWHPKRRGRVDLELDAICPVLGKIEDDPERHGDIGDVPWDNLLDRRCDLGALLAKLSPIWAVDSTLDRVRRGAVKLISGANEPDSEKDLSGRGNLRHNE